MKIQSTNPATEQVNKEFEIYSKEQVNGICRNSQKAFVEWRALDLSSRKEYLLKLSSVLKEKSKEYGKIITVEMGKPLKQSVSEVEKCAWAAEVYAQNAEKWLEDEPVDTGLKKSFIAHEPLGVILSVMPWNFPFWQAMRFAIPALTVGNCSVLRHSNTVPMSALAIEESFGLAGFPENVFRTIITDHDEVKRLIRSPLIDGVSLTGSVDAGRNIGGLAGKNIKKFVLELGGSDPFIVLDDADIELSCKGATDGRLVNSGQSCICSKRFIVVKKVADQFTRGFTKLMESQRVGDPMDMNTDVGPLANRQQLEKLESQVRASVEEGATIATGGKRVEGRGFFYKPTVMTNVKSNMTVAKEEVFGPVAPIIVVRNEKEALRVANNSKFGLGGSVWTRDIERGERFAREIEAGIIYVNSIVKSDPRVPFGGVKQSGIGRELSRYGLLEFTNTKSILIS